MKYYDLIIYDSFGNQSNTSIQDLSELNFKQIPKNTISIKIQEVISQEFYSEAVVDEKLFKIGKIVSQNEVKKLFGENSPKFQTLIKSNAEKALLTRENEVYPYKNGKCPVKFIDENNIDEQGYLHGKPGQTLSFPTTFARFEYIEDDSLKRCEVEIDEHEIGKIKLPKNIRKAIIFNFAQGRKTEDKKIYYFGEFYSLERIKTEFPFANELLRVAKHHNGLCRFNKTSFQPLTHPIEEITFLNPIFINKNGYYRPYEDKIYIDLEWGKNEIRSRNLIYQK